MLRPSSSTSGSERGPGNDLRDAAIVAAWALLFLAAADVAVDRLYALPADRMAEPKGRLQVFFNLGRSVEAKLRRGVGPTDATTTPLMSSGWIEPPRPEAAPPPGVDLVMFYGMSYTSHVANAMSGLDPKRFRVGMRAAPNAPTSRSYAVYRIDRGGPARVVVLGVLGSNVHALAGYSSLTWGFDYPAPYSYPRYFPGPSGLESEEPLVRTLGDLRARLAEPDAWEQYVAQIRATDPFYNRFAFRSDVGDRSALARLVRRAVAHRDYAARLARIHGPDGFAEESPVVASLRAIVAAFAADVRRDGKLPVLLLIENQGYRDHVTRALAPVLARDRIPHLGTHAICPDTDPRNFAPDGHFNGRANLAIARALLDVIRAELRVGE